MGILKTWSTNPNEFLEFWGLIENPNKFLKILWRPDFIWTKTPNFRKICPNFYSLILFFRIRPSYLLSGVLLRPESLMLPWWGYTCQGKISDPTPTGISFHRYPSNWLDIIMKYSWGVLQMRLLLHCPQVRPHVHMLSGVENQFSGKYPIKYNRYSKSRDHDAYKTNAIYPDRILSYISMVADDRYLWRES